MAMARRPTGTDDANGRSIGQLIGDLLREGSELFQEEVALARTEMATKLPVAGRSAGMIAGGAALAYGGLLAVMAAIIIALHYVLPWWASALLVGVVVIAVGYLLIQSGLQTLKNTSLVPRRTVASLRGYQEVARPRATSAFSRHSEGGY